MCGVSVAPDLAVCIPSEQIFRVRPLSLHHSPHQPFAALSKVSDVFEISRVRRAQCTADFELWDRFAHDA